VKNGGDPVAGTSRKAEVELKLGLIREWLDERRSLGVALTTSAPVAWLTAGLTNPIDRSDPGSPLWLVVTPSHVVALTTDVEAPRLGAEAGLDELGFSLESVPWFDPDAFVQAAQDVAGATWQVIAPDEDELTAMRLRLFPAERERLAQLGGDVARALESAVVAWEPGERDLDVQARLVHGLEALGALPVCIIVGGDERVERFRHPLATGEPIERLVMAVAVAMRDGLHVAATRFARRGRLPDGMRTSFETALDIEAHMLDAHRPGATYGDVLRACEDAYAEAGHPRAWREHYQGGPIGYRQREFEIAPSQRDSRWFSQPVEIGNAVAWNPSIAGGGKVEDTFLVEEGGLRRLTDSLTWPAVEVRDGRQRCGVLDIAR
jgi:Xaa-Pro aminopeptidase